MTGARPPRSRLVGDAGQVAGVEALPFGVLIFVIGSLLVANAWAVVDAKLAVEAAAREAVRVYVESPDAGTGMTMADRAARDAITGHGRDADRAEVTVHHEGDQPFRRCLRATVTVTYRVPALSLPIIGGYGDGIDAHASHSERIDPYRAGLAAEGGC